MNVTYSKHLIFRLELRNIAYELPKIIFEESKEKYWDAETGHNIAVMNVDLYGKKRDVMIAYTISENEATILTIHPLQEAQKEKRVLLERWRKLP